MSQIQLIAQQAADVSPATWAAVAMAFVVLVLVPLVPVLVALGKAKAKAIEAEAKADAMAEGIEAANDARTKAEVSRAAEANGVAKQVDETAKKATKRLGGTSG